MEDRWHRYYRLSGNTMESLDTRTIAQILATTGEMFGTFGRARCGTVERWEGLNKKGPFWSGQDVKFWRGFTAIGWYRLYLIFHHISTDSVLFACHCLPIFHPQHICTTTMAHVFTLPPGGDASSLWPQLLLQVPFVDHNVVHDVNEGTYLYTVMANNKITTEISWNFIEWNIKFQFWNGTCNSSVFLPKGFPEHILSSWPK